MIQLDDSGLSADDFATDPAKPDRPRRKEKLKPEVLLWPKKIKDDRPEQSPTWRKAIRSTLHETIHQTADEYDGNDVCYFIGGKAGPVKIGVSANVVRRLKVLQAGSPVLLHILAVVPGGVARERAYHIQFDHLRLHNEWFVRHPDLSNELKLIHKMQERRRVEEEEIRAALADAIEFQAHKEKRA